QPAAILGPRAVAADRETGPHDRLADAPARPLDRGSIPGGHRRGPAGPHVPRAPLRGAPGDNRRSGRLGARRTPRAFAGCPGFFAAAGPGRRLPPRPRASFTGRGTTP